MGHALQRVCGVLGVLRRVLGWEPQGNMGHTNVEGHVVGHVAIAQGRRRWRLAARARARDRPSTFDRITGLTLWTTGNHEPWAWFRQTPWGGGGVGVQAGVGAGVGE